MILGCLYYQTTGQTRISIHPLPQGRQKGGGGRFCRFPIEIVGKENSAKGTLLKNNI